MSTKALEDLRETLCEELDEIARKPEMSAGDLEAVHKLTDTIKNIDKICMMEDNDGYSRAGDWEMEGIAYGRGNSYANRGKHYVRGHYSRDDGRDGYSMRGGRRGYSRADGQGRMIDHLDQMMREAGSEKEREAIRRCMEQMSNA